MSLPRVQLRMCCLLTLVVVGNIVNSAAAFGGYPPWGAWAYGSGSVGWNVGYGGWNHLHWHRHSWGRATVYRASYHASYSGLRYSGWGHRGWGHASARFYGLHPAAYSSLVLSIPTYRTSWVYAPAGHCYSPTYYYAPPVVPVIQYCPPLPQCNSWDVGPSYPIDYQAAVTSPTVFSQTLAPQAAAPYALQVSNSPAVTSGLWPANTHPTAGRLVALESKAAISMSSTLPPQLLAAADALMQAGGYRQAATAYAQLHVRYGPSDEIFTRRFVAQIAADDWDQAAVVLASAEAAGFKITQATLPAGQLETLLRGKQSEVVQLTDYLAAQTLSKPNQYEAMSMMGMWMGLVGDSSRADLFLSMAQQLAHEEDSAELFPELQLQPVPEPVPAPEELPAPRSKTGYVSLE
jgi:hypothetical protein